MVSEADSLQVVIKDAKPLTEEAYNYDNLFISSYKLSQIHVS